MLAFLRRLRARIRYRQFDADLKEELDVHRAMTEDAWRETGRDPADARRLAARALGNTTLAREHARHGLRVNVVCPGATHTELFEGYKQGAGNPDKLEEAFRRSVPMGRIGRPDDVVGAVLFLSSRAGSYLTGAIIPVDGGISTRG